eukprot:7373203-Karenia_brevis.AAC.1
MQAPSGDDAGEFSPLRALRQACTSGAVPGGQEVLAVFDSHVESLSFKGTWAEAVRHVLSSSKEC